MDIQIFENFALAPIMDIQIFTIFELPPPENFALAPIMDIQIFTIFDLPPPENLADLSSAKRAGDQVLEDEHPAKRYKSNDEDLSSAKRAADQPLEDESPAKRHKLNDDEVAQGVTRLVEHCELAEAHNDESPPKRYKLNDDEVAEGVTRLVEYYKLDEAQKARLEHIAKLARYTPTVAEVEWVAKEAKLRDGSSNLDIWIFAYMEYFPWFLRTKGEDSRLWTGAWRRYDHRVAYLWIGFPATSEQGLERTIYLDGPRDAGEDQEVFEPPAWARSLVTWHTPLEMMFGLLANFPQDRFNDAKNKTAADHQDEILKAVMKVLARFPGLITELDTSDTSKIYQLYPEYACMPFGDREKFFERSPLAKLFETLCTKVLNKTHYKTLKQETEENHKPKMEVMSNESPKFASRSATKVASPKKTIKKEL